MTYLSENIFKNILAYCDDRIERRQKDRMSNINQTIVELNNLQNKMIWISNKSFLSKIEKVDIIYMILTTMYKDFVKKPSFDDGEHVVNQVVPLFYNDDSYNNDYLW